MGILARERNEGAPGKRDVPDQVFRGLEACSFEFPDKADPAAGERAATAPMPALNPLPIGHGSVDAASTARINDRPLPTQPDAHRFPALLATLVTSCGP